jgi:hypothetical protein
MFQLSDKFKNWGIGHKSRCGRVDGQCHTLATLRKELVRRGENLLPSPDFEPPDYPAYSESLYQLCYLSHPCDMKNHKIN